MKLKITEIKKVDLPNYLETVSSGDSSFTREAPLLAKYQVSLQYGDLFEKLFFEVREQSSGYPLIDEYYEDQIFEVLQKILHHIKNKKLRDQEYNKLISRLTELVFEEWDGIPHTLPANYQITT